MSVVKYLFNASPADWIRFTCFLAGIIIFILIAEKTRVKMNWHPEVNRKLIHILTGILIFFTPFFFRSSKPLIWMAIIFIVVNFIGVKTGKLKSMHMSSRTSYGTVFYPLTFLVLVITCWQNHKVVLMISILILAISDACAAILGENLKHPHEYRLGRDKKSFEGSAIMFFTTFLLVVTLLPLIDQIDGQHVPFPIAIWIAFIISFIATILEALSSGGSDNLSAPLGAAYILHFMMYHPNADRIQLTVGLGLALLISVFSLKVKFLTASGSVGTFLLATLIFGIGGWTWTIPILTFFILSSVLSKMGKNQKAGLVATFEKTNCRDIGQVLANGAVPGIAVILHSFFPDPVWYVIYLGAIAAVNADTWATEIGVFSRTPPRSITGFQIVDAGTSGGVTPLGTVAAFSGAFLIVLTGWVSVSQDLKFPIFGTLFWIVVGSGFLASFIDSLLGATFQAQYRCIVCKKITERKHHCKSKETKLISGIYWLNNDWVNAICSLSGVVFVWIGINSIIY